MHALIRPPLPRFGRLQHRYAVHMGALWPDQGRPVALTWAKEPLTHWAQRSVAWVAPFCVDLAVY